MFFSFIGLVVTLALWSTILTLQPNDSRENYVRRLTSTIGITAVITGSLDMANSIINGYGSEQDGNAHTGVYDVVNGSSLHTTATSTVKISSKRTKSDSSMPAGSLPLSTRTQLLIVVGSVLAMVSFPQKNNIFMGDFTQEGHYTELDQSSLEITCHLPPETEPSLYDQMDFLLSSSFKFDSETFTKPCQTPDSLGSVSPAKSSTWSSATSSPATSRSMTPAPSNVTTPDCTTPQASPEDYNHPLVSHKAMPHCAGDNYLNCFGPDATFHHQLEVQVSRDEGKASPRGSISDTNPIPKATTSQLEQPLTPEQDSTATTPKKRRLPRPSQAKRRRFARQTEQSLRVLALGQDAQTS